jgi:hypothetical protein
VAVNEVTQVSFTGEQQPVGQVVTSQVQAVPLHRWPDWHCVPVLPHSQSPLTEQRFAEVGSQATQASPSFPQADGPGVVHEGPQHPLGQRAALQPLQVCAPVQVCPAGHAWQGAPPIPQAPFEVPERHAPLKQHPLGHETPSHTQAPCTQSWVGGQRMPLVPQLQTPLLQLSARIGSQGGRHGLPPEPQKPTLGA